MTRQKAEIARNKSKAIRQLYNNGEISKSEAIKRHKEAGLEIPNSLKEDNDLHSEINEKRKEKMSIKLTRKQLKQIILEELEEIRTDGRGFGPAQVATAKALSAKGVAKRPESVRTRLMQLVADLDLQNPTQEEIRQIADMVSDLMDAAQDADEAGLEENLLSMINEEIQNYRLEKKKGYKPSKGK